MFFVVFWVEGFFFEGVDVVEEEVSRGGEFGNDVFVVVFVYDELLCFLVFGEGLYGVY